jgi:hypothetical protein
MALTAENSFIIPAISQKEYKELWLYNIVIHAPSSTSGKILIEALPYDATSGEIGPESGLKTISTERLFEVVSSVPEVQEAYFKILDAIIPLQNWINTHGELVEVPFSPEFPQIDPPKPTLD